MIKALALSMVFSFAAQAYTGQPKTVECSLYDGHILKHTFNDVPASSFKFRRESPKGHCASYGEDTKTPLTNGEFSTFAFSMMGCKRTKSGLVVQPTYMNASFWTAPDPKTKNELVVDLLWEGTTSISFKAEVVDKDGNPLETVAPQYENCKVTEFY